jgi:hypothetical protein
MKNFQNAILNKLAISGVPASQSIDMQQFLHAVVPLGFQPYEKTQTRNVALIISKALDYENVVDLFREDEQNEQVAKDSLLLLELITLLFENWANANKDSYLLGMLVSLIEVLIHSAAFWARLKQSAVL